LISASDRANAIKLIDEATLAGAREKMACKELGISQRTLQRWKSDATPLEDQRPVAKRPTPKNKLSEEEVQEVLKVVNHVNEIPKA
jgi:putative transposase